MTSSKSVFKMKGKVPPLAELELLLPGIEKEDELQVFRDDKIYLGEGCFQHRCPTYG